MTLIVCVTLVGMMTSIVAAYTISIVCVTLVDIMAGIVAAYTISADCIPTWTPENAVCSGTSRK